MYLLRARAHLYMCERVSARNYQVISSSSRLSVPSYEVCFALFFSPDSQHDVWVIGSDSSFGGTRHNILTREVHKVMIANEYKLYIVRRVLPSRV